MCELGYAAFSGCSALSEIHSLNVAPPFCAKDNYKEANTFSGVNTNQVFVYVPKGSKEYYTKADVWSNFTCIREEGEGYSNSASGSSNRCAKPQVTFANKTLTLSCSTANAEIHYSYYLSNAGTVKSNQQVPTVTKTTNSLTVIAYATADNYAQSETVIQTFPFDATSYDVNGDNKLTVAQGYSYQDTKQ